MSSLFSAHRGLAAISEARKIISNLSFQDLSKELKIFDHMSMLYTSCISTPPHSGDSTLIAEPGLPGLPGLPDLQRI